jgi:hypothetical protein
MFVEDQFTMEAAADGTKVIFIVEAAIGLNQIIYRDSTRSIG